MEALGGMSNDTRGWIMCIVSGIACTIGASVICVDLIVQRFPGKRDWQIQDSSVFLACSLSLSFGVMLFSALFSMLPSSKKYLASGGLSHQAGGFILVGCFVAGYLGIQVVSRLVHQMMPSHVVDCDHSHGEGIEGDADHDGHRHSHSHSYSHGHSHGHGHNPYTSRRQSLAASRKTSSYKQPSQQTPARPPFAVLGNGHATESTPLLGAETATSKQDVGPAPPSARLKRSATGDGGSLAGRELNRASTAMSSRRPSMVQVQQRVMSFVKDTKSNCDEAGPCFGYTDPCGQECFKHVQRASSVFRHHNQPLAMRTTTGLSQYPGSGSVAFDRVAEEEDPEQPTSPMSPKFRTSRAQSRDARDEFMNVAKTPRTERDVELGAEDDDHRHRHDEDLHEDHDASDHGGSCSQMEEDVSPRGGAPDDLEAQQQQHHHHVPANAFLSIGLQTSIAIALHKFPEGFITYATNHANPALGFSVFMALFVHNITEGFAMALPLYLALGSRVRAMAWSSVLGGLSQPFGAAMAVLWFRLADRTSMSPDVVAYGCLFAATAGIMVSVALQLFVESLSLNHNRNLCIFCAFAGMVIMGMSSALVVGGDK